MQETLDVSSAPIETPRRLATVSLAFPRGQTTIVDAVEDAS